MTDLIYIVVYNGKQRNGLLISRWMPDGILPKEVRQYKRIGQRGIGRSRKHLVKRIYLLSKWTRCFIYSLMEELEGNNSKK